MLRNLSDEIAAQDMLMESKRNGTSPQRFSSRCGRRILMQCRHWSQTKGVVIMQRNQSGNGHRL